MKNISLCLIAAFLGALVFASCKKELSCDGCGAGNKAPVANAGHDQLTVLPKDSVTLDGSASTDEDGTIKSYKWIRISGPASFVISKPNEAKTTATSLVMGVYQFELTVKDNGGLSSKDTVQIIVDNPAINQPPIADAGPDKTIHLPLNNISLDGSKSTDPENNITSYNWTKISGPTSSNISNANTMQAQVADVTEGLYQFELKVTDAGGLFSKDTVQVTVQKPLVIVECGGNRQQSLINAIAIATHPNPIQSMSVIAAGNKIFFAGGELSSYPSVAIASKTVNIYDITTNTWSTSQLSVARYHMTAIAAGNKVFFAGGMTGEIGDNETFHNTVDIYDLATNSWSATVMSEEKYAMAAATAGDKVFFAGGYGINKVGNLTYNWILKNKVEIYDISTNTWSVSTLSEAKSGISAVAHNNKIYFAGGYVKGSTSSGGMFGAPDQFSNKIEIYDNSTGSWSISYLNEPRYAIRGIAVSDKIYWAAGVTVNGPSCKVEIKDMKTQNTTFQSLSDGEGWGPFLKDDKLIYPRWNRKFDIYNLNANTWSVGILPSNIPIGPIVSINNKLYLATGEQDINGKRVFTGQIYRLDF